MRGRLPLAQQVQNAPLGSGGDRLPADGFEFRLRARHRGGAATHRALEQYRITGMTRACDRDAETFAFARMRFVLVHAAGEMLQRGLLDAPSLLEDGLQREPRVASHHKPYHDDACGPPIGT